MVSFDFNMLSHYLNIFSLPLVALVYAVSPDPSSFRYYIPMALNLSQSYPLSGTLLKEVHTAIVIPLFCDFADKLRVL